MQITFREYQKEDFGALEKIIRKTWHYDDLCSPKTAQKLAKVFLSSCLTNYTFSCVALDEGVPVGIILVNNKAKHKCPLGLRVQQIKAITSLYPVSYTHLDVYKRQVLRLKRKHYHG